MAEQNIHATRKWVNETIESYAKTEEVNSAIDTAINGILGEDVSEAYDTLKEIQNILEGTDGETIDGLIETVNSNKENIEKLNGDVNTEGSIAKAISELPGKSSEGENSVIFGSSSNEFSEVVLPENVYYKPIIEEFIEYVETNKIFADGTMWDIGGVYGEGTSIFPSEKLAVGDICLLKGKYFVDCTDEGEYIVGDEFSGYVKITDVADCDGHDVYDEETGEVIGWDQSTDGYVYFEPISTFPDRPELEYANPPLTEWSLTVVNAYNKFENLTFITEPTGTLLEKLYTYTDKWGNKCYTVYPDYAPDIADGTTDIAKCEVSEVAEDDEMINAIKYEALFNEGTYFAVADGDNSLSAGTDTVAVGDDSVSMGYLNIALGNGSSAIGRKLLVRGVGASAFGITGVTTGRYAVAFNEGGRAIGYASLAFGDHCVAYTYNDVAGGFQSVAKGGASFAFGRNVEASAAGAIAFGQLTKADGQWCLVGGNQNKCSGMRSLVYGLFNDVSDNDNLTVGQSNIVTGADNLVAGVGNKVSGTSGLSVGQGNILSGKSGSAVFGNKNTVAGNNGSVAIGMQNTIEKERSFAAGQSNTVSGNNDIVGGSNNNVSGTSNIVTGSKNNVESKYTAVFGSNNIVTTTASYSIVGGSGNTASGYYNHIIGSSNIVSGEGNIIGGAGNTVSGNRGLAIGSSNTLEGSWGSTVFGISNVVTGKNGAIASGIENNVSADVGLAFGYSNIVNGTKSAVFGTSNSVQSDATNSIIVGKSNTTNYENTSLFGFNLNSKRENQTVIGEFNDPRHDALFVIGNGDWNNNKNAMVVTHSGGVECDTLKATTHIVTDGLVCEVIRMDNTDSFITLTSPNGSKYKITVADNGTLVTEGVQ